MTSNLLTTYLKLHDELVLRERIRTNLVDWATDVMTASGLTPSAHHRFLLDSLDLVVQGTVKRLMVLMPPGSAKSTYTSDIVNLVSATSYEFKIIASTATGSGPPSVPVTAETMQVGGLVT